MITRTGRSSGSPAPSALVVAVLAVLWVLVPACSKDTKDDNDNNDAGDTGSDSDTDSDTDTDADTDTGTDTDSDSDADTDEYSDTEGCFETPFIAAADSCTYALDWSGVPESWPDPPYAVCCLACQSPFVIAHGEGGEPPHLHLEYSPDCADESPGDGVFGWRWVGIDAPHDELQDYDLDACTELELCPAACERLWDGTWSSVEILFWFLSTEIGGPPC
jgi:hypothetical protein